MLAVIICQRSVCRSLMLQIFIINIVLFRQTIDPNNASTVATVSIFKEHEHDIAILHTLYVSLAVLLITITTNMISRAQIVVKTTDVCGMVRFASRINSGLVFRELVAGDNEFRIDHRQHLEEQAALAAERSEDEDGEDKTKGRKVALALGERDEFT